MIYKGILEKIESTHNNLRTDTVQGTFEPPEIGKSFILYGEGLEFGVRVIQTTPIKELTKEEKGFCFKTMNSTYKLSVEELNND